MMKVIEQNPYRILGVYSNSPKKEVIANKNKMNAFLKVGKSASFLLDLNGILSPIVRNSDIVTKADSAITLPQGQVEAGQFWFIKMSGIDEVAFNHLLAGDIVNAMAIWEKKVCASSLQNRLVCYLIRGEYQNAIECAERLYGNYLNELVVAIVGENFTINEDDFIVRFEKAILSEKVMNPMDFMNGVHNDSWKSHLKDAVVNPLLKQITDAIEESNKVDRDDAEANLEAGTKLMDSTKVCLDSLRQLLPTSDLVYEKIADKLGLRILQCGINYYNASEDEYEPAKKAIVLQKYALSIVVGQMAKDRCQENVDTLVGIVETPPEVVKALMVIKKELDSFHKKGDSIKSADTLITNVKPQLNVLSRVLGTTNEKYLNISTHIVNEALGGIIKDVNETQEQFKKFGGAGLRVLSEVLDSAWSILVEMQLFDMEYEYRVNRFMTNKNSLDKMRNQIKEMIEDNPLSYIPYSSGNSTTPAYHSTASTYSSSSYSKSSSNEDITLWSKIKKIFEAIWNGILFLLGGIYVLIYIILVGGIIIGFIMAIFGGCD